MCGGIGGHFTERGHAKQPLWTRLSSDADGVDSLSSLSHVTPTRLTAGARNNMSHSVPVTQKKLHFIHTIYKQADRILNISSRSLVRRNCHPSAS